jgi:hypothetical protein
MILALKGKLCNTFHIMIYREVYIPYRLENWANAAGITKTADNAFTYITTRMSHRNGFWKERRREHINYTAGFSKLVSQSELDVTPTYSSNTNN